MNKLFYGDNLDIMRRFITDESVDLCYIDPPFNSKRNYNQIYNNVGQEDTAQAQAFVDTWIWDDAAERGLAEIQTNPEQRYSLQTVYLMNGLEKTLGKGTLFAYIVSLTIRVNEIRRVLKSTGSFYLHCDPTSSHYIKIMLDSVFCSRGGDFLNEITWSYKRYTAVSKKFQRLHDIVFWYSKDKDYTFNEIRGEYGGKSGKMDSHYKQDEDGSWFRWQKRKGQEPYKIYLSEGRRIGDVWEIPIINASAKERLGYPTQKPEALLDRIIRASCNEDDTVLDAYSGCGTTVAVAHRLNRKWIGIDITYQSISLILKRLEDTYGKEIIDSLELSGVPKDLESARALALKKDDKTRKEFEKWAILTYSNNRAMINEKKGSDKGIDGRAFILTQSGASQEIIFSVKSGKAQVSDVRDLRGTVEREKAAGGILITLNQPTSHMLQEAKSAGFIENTPMQVSPERIKIVTVEKILSGDRFNIPFAFDVVKSAKLDVKQSKQKNIFDDDEMI